MEKPLQYRTPDKIAVSLISMRSKDLKTLLLGGLYPLSYYLTEAKNIGVTIMWERTRSRAQRNLVKGEGLNVGNSGVISALAESSRSERTLWEILTKAGSVGGIIRNLLYAVLQDHRFSPAERASAEALDQILGPGIPVRVYANAERGLIDDNNIPNKILSFPLKTIIDEVKKGKGQLEIPAILAAVQDLVTREPASGIVLDIGDILTALSQNNNLPLARGLISALLGAHHPSIQNKGQALVQMVNARPYRETDLGEKVTEAQWDEYLELIGMYFRGLVVVAPGPGKLEVGLDMVRPALARGRAERQ